MSLKGVKPVIYLDWINRNFVRDHPNDIFIFGDNILRSGFGGQAKEMRGELNAVGVMTKRKPTMDSDAFLSDDNPTDMMNVATDLMRVMGYVNLGYQIYAPKKGLGTERARLKEKAPKIHAFIVDFFRELSDGNFPWE